METITGFVEPVGEFDQFVEDKSDVSCNTNPGMFVGQEIRACPGANPVIDRADGGAAVYTKLSKALPAGLSSQDES